MQMPPNESHVELVDLLFGSPLNKDRHELLLLKAGMHRSQAAIFVWPRSASNGP